MYNKELIEKVKQIPITQFLLDQGYELGKATKTGSRHLYTNCVLCGSTSPRSDDNGHFFVNDTTNTYCTFAHCRPLQGDIINLVRQIEKKDFKTAVELLIDKYNIK